MLLPLTSGGSSFTVALANEQATERLVTDIAAALVPGDLVTLSGDLGAGKTTFARAMIRYLADNPDIPVPSPTFTLIQTYELPLYPVVHADLYRLEGPGELAELGFDDLPVAQDVTPALTTVRLDLRAMGATAMELVLDDQPAGRTIAAPAELVVRESTLANDRR
jgi:hypothetical protein